MTIASTPEERDQIRAEALHGRRAARNRRSAQTTDGVERTPIGPSSKPKITRDQGRARFFAHTYHGKHPIMLDFKRLARQKHTKWYPTERQAELIFRLCPQPLRPRDDGRPTRTR